MPRGPEPKTPLSEREKLQLKQRGDNLRRRQGLGSGKYAEFFFRHRHSYPFTRKTYPSPLGRVEAGNDAWDGIDPDTGRLAEWVRPDDGCGCGYPAGRRMDDDLDVCHYRLVKRLRSSDPAQEDSRQELQPDWEQEPSPKSAGGGPSSQEGEPTRLLLLEGGEERAPVPRDLKVLMDALRRIPTPLRAARAIEGMLSKREVRKALEKYGSGSQPSLSTKELAAISVLQNGVMCRER